MSRAENLELWRAGFAAGYAPGTRDQQLADLAAAVRDFDAERRAERQARINTLMQELIGVLADAMLADYNTEASAA